MAVLRDLAGMVEANLPGTLADLDTEFLHDLRVAVRRSRTVLRELAGAFPPSRSSSGGALKWVQAFTGPTRDLDVQLLEEWDHLLSAVPAERHAALAPCACCSSAAGPARSARSRPSCGDRRTARRGAPGAFLDGDLGPARERPDARRPIAQVAGRRIRKVYARMVEMGAGIDAGSPADDLHELRKRGKELRYLLELFGGLWPSGVVKPMVRSLKGLQDVLGTHQDREVQSDHMRDLADELAPGRRPPGAGRARRPARRRAAGRPRPVRRPVRRLRGPQAAQAGGQDVRAVKVVATYNIKGGVGKTSAAVNLAALAARDGLRTLLWDLDPQGAASFLFRISPRCAAAAASWCGDAAPSPMCCRAPTSRASTCCPPTSRTATWTWCSTSRASPPAGCARCWPR